MDLPTQTPQFTDFSEKIGVIDGWVMADEIGYPSCRAHLTLNANFW
jgi:hypothetical protein